MGRRLAVRVLAWAMRRGVTVHQAEHAIEQAFPWRDEIWQLSLLADAQARNRARTMKAIT